MDKAEQPTIEQALKPCPEVEAIAQEVADRSRWKKTTDNYARIYQAAYAGAIAAMNARTTSLAAQDGLVGLLRESLVKLQDAQGAHVPKHYACNLIKRIDAALSAIKEQHHD